LRASRSVLSRGKRRADAACRSGAWPATARRVRRMPIASCLRPSRPAERSREDGLVEYAGGQPPKGLRRTRKSAHSIRQPSLKAERIIESIRQCRSRRVSTLTRNNR
jgi:hypothetical protein